MRSQTLLKMGALAALIASVVSVSNALTPDDFLIASLPGVKTMPAFKQYSGYMPLDNDAKTEIFFWFVEAETAPAEKPVIACKVCNNAQVLASKMNFFTEVRS